MNLVIKISHQDFKNILLRFCLLLVALCIVVMQSAPAVLAVTPSPASNQLSAGEQQALTEWPNWVASQCSTSSSVTVNFGAGTLPSSVPSPYNGIFTAAANQFNIAPAFLAAIFYGGEHGNSFPDPPPPYGHGAPWASSGVGANGGAKGPFQFEDATWQSYQQDGNGDGTKDVQDLADASFGAADYLSALGAKNTTDESALRLTAAHYNGGPGDSDVNGSYASNVWAAFQKFSGPGVGGMPTSPGPAPAPSSSTGCPSVAAATGNGAYQNPLRDIKSNGSLVAHRIDEGVDYGGHGNVYAIGNGTVSFTGSGDWFSAYGQSIVYTLSDGPAKGWSVYFSESCTPNPSLSVGDQVIANGTSSDTVICSMHGDNDPWIETGWAIGGDSQDQPCAGYDYTSAGNPDGSEMAYGVNFSQLLASLGAPAGNSVPGFVSTNPGTIVGNITGGACGSKGLPPLPSWN